MLEMMIYDKLLNKIPKDLLYTDIPMKHHTHFKIGGNADILITPNQIDQIEYAFKILKEHQVPITWLGNGSNLLVSDKGIRGAVIKISDTFSKIKVQGNRIIAEAGALLETISKIAVENKLSGFEFACGIPGTVGGAVYMNAGAYGGEMAQVTENVTVLTTDGDVKILSRDELKFAYRRSHIQDKGYVVLKVEILLAEGDEKEIQAMVDDLTEKRVSKQPLELPSAGSTFKRPTGYYAGKLIQDSGLRGLRYGDAQVSEKHCGFIVNIGDATSEQVVMLIRMIQKTVLDIHGVQLETEVRMIGEGF